MIKFRIILYISAIVSCLLIAFTFATQEETAVDQIRSRFNVKPDENVILLTTKNPQYIQILLSLSDNEIDRITASTRSKLLVINSSHDRMGIKSNRIRLQSHPLSADIETLPEHFITISETTECNSKITHNTPMNDPLLKIRQDEKDRLRMIQILTFTFAKHKGI